MQKRPWASTNDCSDYYDETNICELDIVDGYATTLQATSNAIQG